MELMDRWNAMKRPPAGALSPIGGGRLSGKTDIKPQWRYQVMTEQYGPCGTGWKFAIERTWMEQGSAGQVCACAEVSVYVKNDGTDWSDPIPGVGGSLFVENEKDGPHTSEYAFQMAVTAAIGKALQMLGVAADIYLGLWNGSDYTEAPAPKASSGGASRGGGGTYSQKCPKCQGPMWDNRGSKKSPNQPDAKCKKKRDQCDGAIWETKEEANPPPGPAQTSTQSQGSPNPPGSGTKPPPGVGGADRQKQDEAIALAVSLGIDPGYVNAFCLANMSRIPLFDMPAGALVNLIGKIKSGVVEQWALAQKGVAT